MFVQQLSYTHTCLAAIIENKFILVSFTAIAYNVVILHLKQLHPIRLANKSAKNILVAKHSSAHLLLVFTCPCLNPVNTADTAFGRSFLTELILCLIVVLEQPCS